MIGEREAEAVERVERFLDSAVMATAARVRIVHGHGMGILRRAIQDLLKNSPHVEKFYPASQYEGGTRSDDCRAKGVENSEADAPSPVLIAPLECDSDQLAARANSRFLK